MSAVYKPPCTCGHPHSLHDTGWDAAGCMHQTCSCRSYVEANPDAQKVATAKELLDSLGDGVAPYIEDAGKILCARVEKVLTLEPKGWAGWDCSLAEVRRILNGEEP